MLLLLWASTAASLHARLSSPPLARFRPEGGHTSHLSRPGALALPPPLLPRAHRTPQAAVASIAGQPVTRPEDETEKCLATEASTMDLVGFILPTLAGWLSSEVMSVVDTAVVGSASAAELAALGPATMLTDSGAYLFFWLNVATTNLFASNLAQGQVDDAYAMLSDALYIAVGCGLLLSTALALGGGAALRAICWQAPVLVPAAHKYLSIRLLGLPAFIAGTVLQAMSPIHMYTVIPFRSAPSELDLSPHALSRVTSMRIACIMQAACLAAKDSISPLFVLMCAGALNLVLDVWLVSSMGMGIGGAAVATLFSQLVQAALLALVVQRKRANLGVSRSWSLVGSPPSPAKLFSFLAFAGPIFLVLLGKIACYNSMTLAATSSGVVALAAHQVLASVFFFGCKFGDAVSQTAQAFLPACLDESSDSPGPAQRLSWRLLKLSSVLGSFISILAYFFVTRYSRTITSASPLLFVALFAHASCMCSEGLLMGARQLQFLARAYMGNIGLFLSGLYLVARRAAGLNAVWCGLAIFQYVRLFQFLARARQINMLQKEKQQ